MLPIGVDSFPMLRNDDFRYVDKTPYLRDLIESGRRYFLSRPRRFGKSLLVSTLKSLFRCERQLFKGLAIEPYWDWSRTRRVMNLSFDGGSFNERGGLHRNVTAQLEEVEEDNDVRPKHAGGPERLSSLLRQLRRATGRRVAVLVDEYDKPILDVLDQPDQARANRDYLRNLYSAIKRSNDHVHFCLLTGVSKFSKVNLFSGLNNLEDITLDPRYSAICGYTEHDLNAVFADKLEGLDRERVRDWYGGYSWGGEERVYNPIDVLLLLKRRQFLSWWWETGSPTFLIDLLAEKRVPWHRLDGMLASEQLLSQFDVGSIAPEALLFQTGYLTVLGTEEIGGRLRNRLGYPNREVRQCLNEALLDSVLENTAEREDRAARLADVLRRGDLAGLERQLRALLAGIPHQWHGRNPMRDYEGWYASVLYAHFAALGVEVQAEESGSRGRSDLCVRGYGRVYVFEFKMQGRGGPLAALEQLKARGYAARYKGRGEPVHLVGMESSAEDRTLTRFATERA